MATAVIDGDIILYKASAAGEKRTITVTHNKSGRKKEFEGRREFKKWLAENDKWKLSDFTIKPEQHPDKLENCLYSAKHMIQTITEAAGCDKHEIYLGKGESFRKFLDLPMNEDHPEKSGYKGNRDQLKPVHFQAVKEYLIDRKGAVLIEDIEADDMISIRMWEGWKAWEKSQKDEDKVVGCTTDKDGKQQTGFLFNWDKYSEPFLIDGLGCLYLNDKGEVDGYGRMWMYHQMIVGDPVDNYKPTEIAGVKFGEKSSHKLLKDCITDQDAIHIIADLYREWYPQPMEYQTWRGEMVTKNWIEISDMYWKCARMRRWRDDDIDFKEVLKNMGALRKGE